MAILLGAQKLSKAFGARPLFEGVSFSIQDGERIGLIGPNGAGKSTLLRILTGQVSPDSGSIAPAKGLRLGFLEQVPAFAAGATVESTLSESAAEGDWEAASRVDQVLSELGLKEMRDRPVAQLSGGWKKRVALARECVRAPDLLLLDEPTNHLDIETIVWLEGFLAKSRFATLTITHDRAFLRVVANRLLELDRRNPDGLLSVQGSYDAYLMAKSAMLDAQKSQETRLRNRLRRETEWVRRGAAARTTKQQARIARHGELEAQVEDLGERNREQRVRLDFEASDRAPSKLIEARGIRKAYDGRQVLPALDLLITSKTRLGLLGPNGCGKSTLLRLLTGQESPDAGEVKLSPLLQVVTFEQARDSLDPQATLLRTVCPTGDTVIFRGRPVHVRGYLERFLFRHEQMEVAVSKLSGGEQSRLLLARLMLRECNLLVLDEPTNDLDLETLDVLEDVLSEFDGAVILVTHDRYFLDQVADQILAFGTVGDAPGGAPRLTSYASLSQWEEARTQAAPRAKAATKAAAAAPAAQPAAPAPGKRKLSYKDQRELDGMEATILATEEKLRVATEESAKPGLSTARLTELSTQMAALQAELDRLYARWAELS